MLTTANDVAKRIKAGERLLLAAEEKILLSLPAGVWIGGTIPYFMGDKGGVVSREAVFATDIPSELTECKIVLYDPSTLPNIAKEAPENGVTFLILPATSQVHLDYAQNAPDYQDMYMKPIVGWVSGVHMDDLGKVPPKVVDGRTVTAYGDKGIALHGALPAGKMAKLGIVNLFSQGSGDLLTFPEGGFQVKRCLVNGAEMSFSDYLLSRKIDTRLPLVANYSGAMVNASIQAIDADKGIVSLYAPVFTKVEYRIAAPVPDYVKSFAKALPKGVKAVFSCNCILNFLYSELEGKVTEGMTGPITFGEIAYQLLNQTLVYLTIDKV
jgi:hypothetical protein